MFAAMKYDTMKNSSTTGKIFWAKICMASFGENTLFCLADRLSGFLVSSIKTTLDWSGKCSIRTNSMRMTKWMNSPYMIQISMNLMHEV